MDIWKVVTMVVMVVEKKYWIAEERKFGSEIVECRRKIRWEFGFELSTCVDILPVDNLLLEQIYNLLEVKLGCQIQDKDQSQ